MQGQKPPPPAPRTVLRFVQLRRSNEPEARQSSRHRVRRPGWRRSIEPLGGSLHCCQVGSSAHRIAARSEVNGQLPSTAGRRTGWRILPCMLCVAGRVAISEMRTQFRVRPFAYGKLCRIPYRAAIRYSPRPPGATLMEITARLRGHAKESGMNYAFNQSEWRTRIRACRAHRCARREFL